MSEATNLAMATLAAKLGPEPTDYWTKHQPRFKRMMEVLNKQNRESPFKRILDIGMGFQTRLLESTFPEARVDCLGVYRDDRFAPTRPYTYYPIDLNDAYDPTRLENVCPGGYDLIVFMEVIEHLYTSPRQVLRYLAGLLAPGGFMLITTPNAAWMKNRIKLVTGQNPFEMIREDRKNLGHMREYTRSELESIFKEIGLNTFHFERRGLYRFDNSKDRFYSRLADLTHPSLRRTLLALVQRPG
jgi:SAM-dependent methyltransferase